MEISNTYSYQNQPVPGGTVDGNASYQRSRKARTLNMSVAHRFGTDYPVSSCVASFRGSKEDAKNRAFPLNGHNEPLSESAKHGKFGD